jgi:hypothetical protein
MATPRKKTTPAERPETTRQPVAARPTSTEREGTTAPRAASRAAGRTTTARTATTGKAPEAEAPVPVARTRASSAPEAAGPGAGASWEQVSHRAFELWQQAGQPQGRDLEHWLQAEEELRGKAGRGGP